MAWAKNTILMPLSVTWWSYLSSYDQAMDCQAADRRMFPAGAYRFEVGELIRDDAELRRD